MSVFSIVIVIEPLQLVNNKQYSFVDRQHHIMCMTLLTVITYYGTSRQLPGLLTFHLLYLLLSITFDCVSLLPVVWRHMLTKMSVYIYNGIIIMVEIML